MIGTPKGIFLLLDTQNGFKFGQLHPNGRFTDLSNLLPAGWQEFSNGGFPIHTMAWGRNHLWIAGYEAGDAASVISYNSRTGTMTDYSSLYAGFSAHATYLTFSKGNLFVAGSGPAGSFFTLWNTESSGVTDLSGLIPSSIGQVDTVAVGGSSIFLSSGSFGSLHYGILTSTH